MPLADNVTCSLIVNCRLRVASRSLFVHKSVFGRWGEGEGEVQDVEQTLSTRGNEFLTVDRQINQHCVKNPITIYCNHTL